MFYLAFVAPIVNKDYYSTTDIKEYGNYIGNYDNRCAQNFINQFFSKEIEEYFSDVKYSYRAAEGDGCAFEAYLEFVIEDMDMYHDFIADYTQGVPNDTFFYDPSFTEYVYEDLLDTGSIIGDSGYSGDVNILESQIAKILCCDEEQRIIFVALGVLDGDMTRTEFLCTYFDRFQINPSEYQAATVSVDDWEGNLRSFVVSTVFQRIISMQHASGFSVIRR